MTLLLQLSSIFWVECNSCKCFLVSGVKLWVWRGNVQMVWSRSWVFWSSGCTMVSLPLTFGGKPSLSSPQRRLCSSTTDTPSIQGRHFAYSQTQQKMWLLCVFSDKKQFHGREGKAFAKSWSAERSDELNSPCVLEMDALFSYPFTPAAY